MRGRIAADPSQAQAPVQAEEAAPVISANFKRMTSWKNAAENFPRAGLLSAWGQDRDIFEHRLAFASTTAREKQHS